MRATSALVASLLVATACSTHPAPPPLEPACALAAEELPADPLPPDLLRLAPQYFHPAYRGAFLDLIPGTARYAHYDPANPYVRAEPPAGMNRVELFTPHALVGFGPDPGLLVAPRAGAGPVRRLQRSADLMAIDATATSAGAIWILARRLRGDTSLVLVRADRDEPPRPIAGTRSATNARLTVMPRGDIAMAWVEPEWPQGRVTLRLAWLDATGALTSVRKADTVALPRDEADLMLRTGTNLVLAADAGGVAVAWRALADDGVPRSVGTEDRPPETTFPATVRVLRADAGGVGSVVAYPSRVEPLAFCSGQGPWGLDPGGAWAFTLGGRAVFLWVEPRGSRVSSILAAHAGDAAPVVILEDGFDTLLAVHETGAVRAELFAYRSAPEVRRFAIACRRGGS